MKKHTLILAVIALITMACQPVGSGSYRGGMPREYHSAYVQSYGRCYETRRNNRRGFVQRDVQSRT